MPSDEGAHDGAEVRLRLGPVEPGVGVHLQLEVTAAVVEGGVQGAHPRPVLQAVARHDDHGALGQLKAAGGGPPRDELEEGIAHRRLAAVGLVDEQDEGAGRVEQRGQRPARHLKSAVATVGQLANQFLHRGHAQEILHVELGGAEGHHWQHLDAATGPRAGPGQQVGVVAHVLEQGGLPDAGRAVEHEREAAAGHGEHEIRELGSGDGRDHGASRSVRGCGGQAQGD